MFLILKLAFEQNLDKCKICYMIHVKNFDLIIKKEKF